MTRTPLLPTPGTTPRHAAGRTRAVGAGVLAAAAALSLAACGPSSTSSASTPSAGATTGSGSQGRAARNPGTTGLIAQVSGDTMQVQTRTAQTAVTYTSSTKVTKTVAGSATSVTVGSCVLVRDASASPDTSGSVTAASVTVAPATKGTCRANAFGGGLGGFGGGRGGGGNGGGGTGGGSPTGSPTGGRGGVGGVTFGSVTAVTGSGFTLTPVARGGAGSTASSGIAAPVTVATSSSTTYDVVEAGTSSDVKVGECVTAQGKADDTGTVSATALSLRPAVNGSCTMAGRRGGAGGGAGGSSGTGSSATTGASNA
ncbi:hypothetical protein [Lapillicoccus jejuensis]|uniref:DUF5666 domain-containing protein n=1 Tax=Lapillicoccus jejuensis TaxID=402171 RepID=A0A542DZU3_9MICO|nr:hypothetical protein [Lapillicoccus jejuensis]TQJ08559.1 hypothetical protein FB458_1649 [Lapillicoccus jejuensis]